MTAQEAPIQEAPIEVLAIIPQDSASEQISQTAEEQGFIIRQESSFKEGQAIIKREGYRYRIALINIGIATNVTDWIAEVAPKYPWLEFSLFVAGSDLTEEKASLKNTAKAFENLISTPQANVQVSGRGGSPDTDTVVGTMMELLYGARSQLVELPEPPYQAGDTRFLKEVGPLLFSISRTDHPWELESDVFTLPVGGRLSRAWQKELGSENSSQLLDLIDRSVSKQQSEGSTALYEQFTYSTTQDETPRTKSLILSVSGGVTKPNVSNAVEACLSAINLATKITGSRTLVLPVLGGGSAGLPGDEIIRGVLNKFDKNTKLGDLKHVIFTVYEPSVFDSILTVDSEPQVEELQRVQKLENDVPSGPDRLRVESEVHALADAIALNDMSPPLVMGVLGGWGTGKSFVLHLIKERLRQIRCWDLTDETVRSEFPYIGHPYLIHFDAWTYAKSDLWASLMQRILLDLDRQLSLEKTLDKASPGLLLQGLDIWSLLDGLSDKQIESLETEMGTQAITAFENWKKGEKIAESLWGVLSDLKGEEVKKLNKAKKELKAKKEEHAKAIAQKTQELNDETAKQQRELEQALEIERTESQAEIDKLQADLEAAKAAAEAQAKQAIEKEAHSDAWTPAADFLENYFGKTVKEILNTTVVKKGDTSISIYSVAKEIKLSTKYLKGLLHSKTAIGFVAFAILALCVPMLADYIKLPELLASVIGSSGFLGGAIASVYTVLTKLNREFEKQQKDFDERLQKGVEKRDARQKQLLQENIATMVEPVKAALKKAETTAEAKYENLEANKQSAMDETLKQKRADLEEVKKSGEKEIKNLQADVETHERRAGMVGRADSLLDVVRQRRANKFYDDKLGLLHQVQEDLREVSEALIPIDGYDKELFPRGRPRVILVIDDLDRCSPDKVVQMLEAAQLLVKTNLFVVVIAMDVRYVTRALEKKYTGILVRDGEPSGLDYIEKIVQIPYRVPGIAPGVMRSFLQGQMKDVVQLIEEDEQIEKTAGVEETVISAQAVINDTPVFESSYDPDAEEAVKPIPTRVQRFDEPELSLLTDCCNAVNVSPRAGRRLVNVFKLLKIIWYHRGLDHEPDTQVKRAMMFLLALSSVQPVIMRQVLHFLEVEYREGKLTEKFDTQLKSCIDRVMLSEEYLQTKLILKQLIDVYGKFPASLKLGTIKLDNLRLVKSFSFVGEISHGEQPHNDDGHFEEYEPEEMAQMQGINTKKKTKKRSTKRKTRNLEPA